MARLSTIGFELYTTASAVEGFDNLTGTSSSFTISSTNVHSGTYAAEATSSSTSAGYAEGYVVLPTTTIGYARAYFYFTALPSSNCSILVFTHGTQLLSGAYINSSGQIGVVYPVSNTTTYDTTLSSAISLNTWYCVETKVDTTTNTAPVVSVRLNTTVINTKTGSVTSGTNINQLDFGLACLGTEACSGTVYMDDLVINDGTGSFLNTYAGTGNLAIVRPNGAGDSNTFLTQVGGTAGSANNYTRVDEVTPDNATSYNASNTLSASDLFTVGSSGITGSPTINCVVVGAVIANLTGADVTTAIELQAEQESSGTISKSSPIVPDTTTWFTNNKTTPALYPLILYQDPTNTNWTTTTVGTMQIGYTISTIHTDLIACTAVWAYIDYIPSSAVNASVSQVGASVTATGGSQTVATVQAAAITQSGASITVSGGIQAVTSIQDVSISQVGASLTATGGTQSIATVDIVAISQSAAAITASGGTQTIATVNIVTISQTGATLTLTGGNQGIQDIQDVSVSQLAAIVTANGGIQKITSNTPSTKKEYLLFGFRGGRVKAAIFR